MFTTGVPFAATPTTGCGPGTLRSGVSDCAFKPGAASAAAAVNVSTEARRRLARLPAPRPLPVLLADSSTATSMPRAALKTVR
ncbi:hypothetical protein GO296_04302 [Ralstonia solanacearum]|nr:hypothetical protein [Ralstonia solanacearum]NKF57233.1 hypothetical protein [Ralstonia solanacearum]NKF62088.1 hypothetical protein [Ralstonia solanacearum]NKF67026.1 hypothetical protein [Ralstonia solanacearum]NKF72049.1 hypothetical protein [Ralstonia solanacearum]